MSTNEAEPSSSHPRDVASGWLVVAALLGLLVFS